MRPPSVITRNIRILSFVSLLTDVAGEMLYPVMPVYLAGIGFSVVLIGVLEGFAEAIAGLSKGYFGKLSDATGKRLPFVQAGYALSALSRPMLAIWTFPVWIFFARTLDRLGKGVRTGARDALLSDETTAEHKGKVFGFHRSLDTLGAVVGPVAALLFLQAFPGNYRQLFLWAFIPGVLAIVLTLAIRERKTLQAAARRRPGFADFINYWKDSPVTYRKLIGGLLLFALFNSSDVFLLLKIREAGYSDSVVIGAYIFYNLVYALAAYPAGMLADRIGMNRVLPGGLLVFAAVYAGMAFAGQGVWFFVLFFMYGIYAASTEGIAKAWITNICRREDTATAVGTYTAFQSIAALVASSLTGIIWFYAGPVAAFMITAVVSLAVAFYLMRIRPAGTQ